MEGSTVALFGDSGSGKTTQVGEYAKFIYKRSGTRTRLNTADLGGYESIMPLVRAGIVIPNEFDPGSHDPWIWINEAVTSAPAGVGLNCFDSGTSMSEALLTACAKSDFKIGQQNTQRFTVSKGDAKLNVSINNEAHYGVVQGFMLDAIWRSMGAARKGVDVLWTFSVHRGEMQDRGQILGPKLAGKALTPSIPKWFKYCWRIDSIPQEGGSPVHRLYLQEYPELAGMGHSFGNARYPMGATTALPPFIEPASIADAFRLIAAGHEEADAALKAELGL